MSLKAIHDVVVVFLTSERAEQGLPGQLEIISFVKFTYFCKIIVFETPPIYSITETRNVYAIFSAFVRS